MLFKLDKEHEKITKETIKEQLQEYSTIGKSTRTISRQLLNPNDSTNEGDYKKLKITITLEEPQEKYPKPIGAKIK